MSGSKVLAKLSSTGTSLPESQNPSAAPARVCIAEVWNNINMILTVPLESRFMVEMVSQHGGSIVEQPGDFFLARALLYDFS